LKIKLIDFGFSEVVNENKLKNRQGTAGYIAPELFKLSPYTRKSDVFSLGIIFYAIISNSSPFKGDNYEELI
jgi:serine/threonine protein kinase